MKKDLSFQVVCPKGHLPGFDQEQALEEEPDAQDGKISVAWQAVFSSRSQIGWIVSFWPFVAGRHRHRCNAGAAQRAEDRGGLAPASCLSMKRASAGSR